MAENRTCTRKAKSTGLGYAKEPPKGKSGSSCRPAGSCLALIAQPANPHRADQPLMPGRAQFSMRSTEDGQERVWGRARLIGQVPAQSPLARHLAFSTYEYGAAAQF
jgi:hypothetical protein